MFRLTTIGAMALAAAMAAGSPALARAAALDDPMQPPGRAAYGSSAASGPLFTLTSTFIARDRKSAIINGKQVGVGDSVDGARVLEISPTEVRVRHRERVLTLRLLPLSVKQPALTE